MRVPKPVATAIHHDPECRFSLEVSRAKRSAVSPERQMDDWLIVELNCSAALAKGLGARLERRSAIRSDVIWIRDGTGRLWFWEMSEDLLECDTCDPARD